MGVDKKAMTSDDDDKGRGKPDLKAYSLEISAATVADAEKLAELVNSAYRGESSRLGWTTETDILGGQRTDAAYLKERLQNPSYNILLGTRAEEILACVMVEKQEDHTYLGMLTVRPYAQATGIGKLLLDAAEQWAAKQWRSPKMRMTVISSRSELVAWYLRRGYHDSGQRVPFPTNDARIGIPKVAGIELMVLEKCLS